MPQGSTPAAQYRLTCPFLRGGESILFVCVEMMASVAQASLEFLLYLSSYLYLPSAGGQKHALLVPGFLFVSVCFVLRQGLTV